MKKFVFVFCFLILLIGASTFVYAWAAEAWVTVDEGWNLIYGFLKPGQLEDQSLGEESIKAIYAFIPTTQEYARAYPDPESDKLGLIDDDELLNTAFWVYSDKGGATEYWLENMPSPISERPIYQGWNFVGITPEFFGYSLNQLKGNCDILKVYTFEEGQWANLETKMDDERMLEESSARMRGLVIKVSENCNLEAEDISGPPDLPGMEVIE